ncbi:UDP-glycosyltransferase 86A1 [Sesamum angolense]|uniref:Glycosyltransferase n=1 Tax=Sesamum angolense TaxID=2727404 RepID=A0AAE1WN33_9LAMI|nr:UDP-glycosyltransferase 86A1 [Sesamum angolense]
MSEKFPKPHAIMIALPYQGHITPFVNLALKLASKGIVVTFAHLEFIHHTLSQSQQSSSDLFSEARECGLDVRYTTIDDGFPLEFDRVLHSDEYWESMLRDFPIRVEEFVVKIIQSGDPSFAPFLIADTFYTWPAAIAKNQNLLNVSFWTEPALVFSLAYHMDLLKENGHFPCKDHVEEEINYLPGVEEMSTKDLMSFLKATDTATTVDKVVPKAFEGVKKADFILHNTVHELESETLSALNMYQPNYAVGPINFSKTLATSTVSKSLRSELDCTNWLNSKSPGSVLYVSFGSHVQTSKQVIEEIAHGLLLSEVNFIWVVRGDAVSSADTDVLPAGYLDEIKDKGLIVPWCNQMMVLSHPAVGGFLTHCGWNSVLESIWCGTPMICYPIIYDQPTNRKLVVDDWKIGINLCDGISVERKEVAEKIKSFMSGAASKSLREETKKINAILQNALESDGSSERNFNQFVKDLKAKLMARIE